MKTKVKCIKIMFVTIASLPAWYQASTSELIGSLRNDDGNENSKKAIRLDKHNNNFARATRFFVHFSAVVARRDTA